MEIALKLRSGRCSTNTLCMGRRDVQLTASVKFKCSIYIYVYFAKRYCIVSKHGFDNDVSRQRTVNITQNAFHSLFLSKDSIKKIKDKG